jgi:CheY-like chemotaxis protein
VSRSKSANETLTAPVSHQVRAVRAAREPRRTTTGGVAAGYRLGVSASRRTVLVAVAAMAGGFAVAATLVADGWWAGLGPMAPAALLVGAAVGAAVRSRREAAEQRARRAVVEERLRIARDVHDLVVGTGTVAVELARGTRADVVLMDIRMPELDGLAGCRPPRRQHAGGPVLYDRLHRTDAGRSHPVGLHEVLVGHRQARSCAFLRPRRPRSWHGSRAPNPGARSAARPWAPPALWVLVLVTPVADYVTDLPLQAIPAAIVLGHHALATRKG